MKTRRTILTLTVAVLFAGFTACGNQQEQTHREHADMERSEMPMNHSGHEMAEGNMQSGISEEQAKKILNFYLKMKNALVQTDGEAASNSADNLIAVIGEDAEDLAGQIRQAAQQVSSTSNPDEQRNHFSVLSDHIYTMVKATDATDGTLYRQYCPMAMNNEGAYWLSNEKEIRNPYFGDKMLKCGSVKETISE